MEPTVYPIIGYDLFNNPIIKPDIKHIAEVWLQDIHACVTCLDPDEVIAVRSESIKPLNPQKDMLVGLVEVPASDSQPGYIQQYSLAEEMTAIVCDQSQGCTETVVESYSVYNERGTSAINIYLIINDGLEHKTVCTTLILFDK